MNVHSVSLKGKREHNEDRHNIILNSDGKNKNIAPINFFGIYDGHGGAYVSKFLSENLPLFFIDKQIDWKDKVPSLYIRNVFTHVQNKLRKDHNKNASNCGSTCLSILHFTKNNQDYITVMNVGDSRAILCRDNMGIPLTKDHKPNWPEEKIRIENLGGKIYSDGSDFRIKDLSVSRAFGDLESEPFLTAEPEIFRYKLNQNDKFIVMACDGLWDVMSNQDVVNFICNFINENPNNKKINIAKLLASHAIKKGSMDNVSVIIIFLK